MRRGPLLGLLATALVWLGITAQAAPATPPQFAHALCISLKIVYGNAQGHRWDHWICKPGGKTENGTQKFRVWVQEHRGAQTRTWYAIVLPDATVIELELVAHAGDTGRLLE